MWWLINGNRYFPRKVKVCLTFISELSDVIDAIKYNFKNLTYPFLSNWEEENILISLKFDYFRVGSNNVMFRIDNFTF